MVGFDLMEVVDLMDFDKSHSSGEVGMKCDGGGWRREGGVGEGRSD